MKVSVIGAGSWGTALSQAIVDNKNELLLYARSEVARDEINNNHTNSRYLKNIVLPDEVKATSDLEEAVKFYILSMFGILRIIPQQYNKRLQLQLPRTRRLQSLQDLTIASFASVLALLLDPVVLMAGLSP